MTGIQVQVTSDRVEYSSRAGHCTRVIKVFLATPDPRIMGYTQDGYGQREPIAMFESEITGYLEDAKKRLEGRGETTDM